VILQLREEGGIREAGDGLGPRLDDILIRRRVRHEERHEYTQVPVTPDEICRL
jgi:hypothetical protein